MSKDVTGWLTSTVCITLSTWHLFCYGRCSLSHMIVSCKDSRSLHSFPWFIHMAVPQHSYPSFPIFPGPYLISQAIYYCPGDCVPYFRPFFCSLKVDNQGHWPECCPLGGLSQHGCPVGPPLRGTVVPFLLTSAYLALLFVSVISSLDTCLFMSLVISMVSHS